MQEYKFKVGDRVKQSTNYYTHLGEQIGTLIDINAGLVFPYAVKFKGDKEKYLFTEDELKLVVKIKAGSNKIATQHPINNI